MYVIILNHCVQCLASASTAGDKIFINYPNNASYSYEIAIEVSANVDGNYKGHSKYCGV